MDQRDRGRARPAPLRALIAGAGLLVLIGALPLVVVLPEGGVPALLLALRLLAVEFDWAARCYVWVVWRWGQLRAWFHRRSPGARVLVILAILALAAGVIWLVIEEFG